MPSHHHAIGRRGTIRSTTRDQYSTHPGICRRRQRHRLSTKRRARRKKYLRRTKGFFLTKSKLYQSAQEAANRAERFSYRDRRNRKRQFRRLWIQRIGAAARINGLSYSELMHGLKAGGVEVDRKILADLAVRDAAAFAQIAAQAKRAAGAPA